MAHYVSEDHEASATLVENKDLNGIYKNMPFRMVLYFI